MMIDHSTNPGLISKFRRYLPGKRWQLVLLGLASLGFLGAVALVVASLILTPTLPSLDAIKEGKLKVPMRVYTADKVLIGEFGEERRIPIEISSTPKALIDAVLSAEDADFYSHYGVDFLGIARAAWTNFALGGRRQGASTITMQVARNFFLSPERTYIRKLKEVLLSFKLERELSKDEILELYLNKIFLGHRAYGFGAAARIYYGRNLDQLTLPELAMLAGLPKAPSANNPLGNKEKAFARRNYVLGRMKQLGYIDEAIYRDAIIAPVSARRHSLRYDVEAPYISEMVRRYMLDKYSDKTYAGGFHVYTTIHSDYQKAANDAVRNRLMEYDRRHGWRGPLVKRARVKSEKIDEQTDIADLDKLLEEHGSLGNLVPAVVRSIDEKTALVYAKDGFNATIPWAGMNWAATYLNADARGASPKQARDVVLPGDVVYIQDMGDGTWYLAQAPQAAAALISLRSTDGAILALTGGFDFHESKFNRVTQAQRQPGSNIKPFIYSAALEKGFTAATTVSGAPITIEDKNLEDVWRPENYSGEFFGHTRFREALIKSMNLVSVRILRAIGPDYAVDYLTRFGLREDWLPRNLALALGSASATPIDMVTAFSVFNNGGFKVAPYFISRIEDGEHNVIEQANPAIVCHSCPETRLTEFEKLAQQTAETPGNKAAVPSTPDNQVMRVATKEDNTTHTVPLDQNMPTQTLLAPRVISPQNNFIMTSILRDVVNKGTGRRALVLERNDLAGKTGTTNEFKDAWFSGFGADVTTTAWIGFDQPETLGRGEAGASAALPIWIDYMRVALADRTQSELLVPEGIEMRWIDKETGDLSAEGNENAMEEYFILGAEDAGKLLDDTSTGDIPVNPGSAESGQDGGVEKPVDSAPKKVKPSDLDKLF
ncbi:MAG: penicillin-binding protein 1A [Gammaproteobacteria bacterium]|nr:penicillin-binding protein 1A [Gammaproteobacteria bacterium]